MKKEMSPGVVFGIIAVLVIVVGVALWKFAFSGPPAATNIPAGMPGGPQGQLDPNAARSMAGGAAPAGAPAGAPPAGAPAGR